MAVVWSLAAPCQYSISFRAKRGQCKKTLPARQGQNMAVTVLYVPCSLESGLYGLALCLGRRVYGSGGILDGSGFELFLPVPVQHQLIEPGGGFRV